MNTNFTRKAATKSAPHMPSTFRTATPVRSAQPDWVWPGLTRAQLRDIVIDQIG
ncbi:hypothetical protein [Caulobacter sp. FWC2]|uniref:hypothetical protein n=1 Tax=Caulobacter sp. FWC2 TaxID=69664 RepID=UPI000C16153D|nr:hypothetical protein [Caulobacter sp. FWC2]PIB93022.1 hypothetical protein CSW62_16455 [Caulobacter sp. FWC2]